MIYTQTQMIHAILGINSGEPYTGDVIIGTTTLKVQELLVHQLKITSAGGAHHSRDQSRVILGTKLTLHLLLQSEQQMSSWRGRRHCLTFIQEEPLGSWITWSDEPTSGYTHPLGDFYWKPPKREPLPSRYERPYLL